MGRLAAYEEAFDEDEEEEMGETEEDDIIQRLNQVGAGKKQYEDSSFPAKKSSLYRNDKSTPDYDAGVGEVSWLRPHDFCKDPDYFKDGAGAGDVVKGRLNDTWLLGALAVIAAHPAGLIENLFGSEPDDFKKYGVYTCRFYKNGEWQEITTDTRVPCAPLPEGTDEPTGLKTPHAPVPIYGRALDLNEQWVALLEKAYAKLHGTYEALNGGSVGEALVDLTGGCCEKIKFSDEKAQEMLADGRMWERLGKFLAAEHVLACMHSDNGRAAHLDSASGVLINHAYSIVGMCENSGFRLIRVRNPWRRGEWTGDWSDASPLWEDYPEVYTAVSSDNKNPWRRDMNDGTFWMAFGDFAKHFNKVYLCRVFADSQFKQYCIHGEWSGKTAGGPATSQRMGNQTKTQRDDQNKLKDSLRRHSLVDIHHDGDPFWFNNPQYRMAVDEPTEVFISLMQQDRRSASHLRDNYAIAFEVVKARKSGGHPRVWERKPDDVVADSLAATFNSSRPEREVTRSAITLDPRHVYNVVPHPMEQGREGKFTLRIFSTKEVRVEPVAETHTQYLRASWDRTSDRDTAGGPLRLVDENKGVRSNSKWCQNPQYWLTIPERATYEAVDVKVVLRRASENADKAGRQGKTQRDAAKVQRRRSSLTHNALMGLVICKANPQEDEVPRHLSPGEGRTNALGELVPVKESSLKRPARPVREFFEDEEEGKRKSALPDRKITVTSTEWCQMSDYKSSDAATTMLKGLRREWMPNGLFIVPTLSEKGIKGQYTLEVHSDHPVDVEELPETVSKTIAAEWTEDTAGGSHLHPEWKKNPVFHLKLKNPGPAKVKITLSRPENVWRNKCMKDSVGCMMGFYLMHGPKPNRTTGTIYHEGKPWDESPFVPTHSVSTPAGDFTLENLAEEDVFCIMPSTFEPGKTGPFFISVVTDAEFSLKRDRGEPKPVTKERHGGHGKGKKEHRKHESHQEPARSSLSKAGGAAATPSQSAKEVTK